MRNIAVVIALLAVLLVTSTVYVVREDQVGVLKHIAEVVGAAGINIISTIVQRFADNRVYLILRLDTVDVDGVAAIFKKAGMQVAHIC